MNLILTFDFALLPGKVDRKEIIPSDYSTYEDFISEILERKNPDLQYDDDFVVVNKSNIKEYLRDSLLEVRVKLDEDVEDVYITMAEEIDYQLSISIDFLQMDTLFYLDELLYQDNDNIIFIYNLISNADLGGLEVTEASELILSYQERFIGIYDNYEEIAKYVIDYIPDCLEHYIDYKEYVTDNYDVTDIDNNNFIVSII